MDLVTITEAMDRDGLRLITRRGIPTPWAQAAKGLIEVKGLPCVLAQEGPDEKGAHAKWVGDQGAPFVAFDREPIRGGWAQILELVERLAPEPRLIPSEGPRRAHMFGLANEICGEMGLGWSLRLRMVHKSLTDVGAPGTFPEPVAKYLGGKYGYTANQAATAETRVSTVLNTLSNELGEQSYFLGELSALDIYWAAFGNMFMLLSADEMPAAPMVADAWGNAGGGQYADLVPANLKQHHRRIYETHLSLPLQL